MSADELPLVPPPRWPEWVKSYSGRHVAVDMYTHEPDGSVTVRRWVRAIFPVSVSSASVGEP